MMARLLSGTSVLDPATLGSAFGCNERSLRKSRVCSITKHELIDLFAGTINSVDYFQRRLYSNSYAHNLFGLSSQRQLLHLNLADCMCSQKNADVSYPGT